MKCVSMVEILGRLRIFDWPVFGLVVSATRCAIIMASVDSRATRLRSEGEGQEEYPADADDQPWWAHVRVILIQLGTCC